MPAGDIIARMYEIRLKRAYDPPHPDDGVRILVERLWPRGVSREKAALDHWTKDIAPSPGLRKWYGHVPEKWPEFQKRYSDELTGNADAVAELRAICAHGIITFIYAAKDETRNSATVLRAYLTDG
ncbi:MAG: hypothetical protein ACI9JL_003866 [Paracoccaceae bacterium]|jgi:uncharacterized protein YeaO (DUF488 family)